MPKTSRPPADYQRLVGQAGLHARLLACLTDTFLSAEDQVREKGMELCAAIKEATPVINSTLQWWTILQPPADPPPSASYFHWVLRRGWAALAHVGVASECAAAASASREQVMAFARAYVPPVDLDWLDIRLTAEEQAAKPAVEQLVFSYPFLNYQVEAAGHWCDWCAANGPAAGTVLTVEDKTILRVLSDAGTTLIISQICRAAVNLIREKGSAQAAGLVTLSDTKVRERLPILETLGLVNRPLGPKGRPTERKGVGITDRGQVRLENMSSPPR